MIQQSMQNDSFTKKENVSSLNDVFFFKKKKKQEKSINIHTAF